jgi:hypothetical protein
MVFFSFLLFEKKKMLGENIWNRRVEVGAKSEKVEQELEGKLPPFSWFCFLLFSYVFYFFCVWKEEDNGNVLSSSFIVVLQRRRRRWQCAIIFFLWWCLSEKGINNFLLLPSFCVRK